MKPLVPDTGGGLSAADPGYSAVRVPDDAQSTVLRVVLRADAGRTQGTGHVMRLLTLGEALQERGHEVILATAEIEVPWLAEAVTASAVTTVPVSRDELDRAALRALRPDWVVVDSYLIPAASVTELDAEVPVLLLADGDSRGARATLYLDQNLGAPPLAGVDESAQLRGASYVLVRRAIRDVAVGAPGALRSAPPRVTVVLGGTDPDDRTIDVARACRRLSSRADFTFVAPLRQHAVLERIGTGPASWRVLAPTPELPALLGEADVIISAGGTSAWDVMTIGTPSILLAVVPNQQASLAAVVREGAALGFDVVDAPGDLDQVARAVEILLDDGSLRSRLADACRARFDGLGGERVVRALERHPRTYSAEPRP